MDWFTCSAISKSSGIPCSHLAKDGFVCGKHTKQAKIIPCNACDGYISHPEQGLTAACGCAFHRSCHDQMLESSHTCLVCNAKTRFSDDDLAEHMNALRQIETEIHSLHDLDAIVALCNKLSRSIIQRSPRELRHSISNRDKLLKLEGNVINALSQHAAHVLQFPVV